MRFRFAWAFAAVSLALAGPASAQTCAGAACTPLFTMDTSAGAYPNAGFGSVIATNANHDRAHMGSIGPGGQGVIQLSQISNPGGGEFCGGQFGMGWNATSLVPTVAQGGTQYWRMRMRLTAATNFQGINWTDCSDADYHTNKAMIAGDGCGTGECRPILEILEPSGAHNGVNFGLRFAIDAGDGDVAYVGTGLVRGTWYAVQLACTSSSAENVADGTCRIWVNNDTFASPNDTTAAMIVETSGWDDFRLGGFVNFGLQADGVYELQFAGAEVDDQFDSQWYANMAAAAQRRVPFIRR
jgi:hypothetical protein